MLFNNFDLQGIASEKVFRQSHIILASGCAVNHEIYYVNITMLTHALATEIHVDSVANLPYEFLRSFPN